jgi:hypothetical protein
MGTGTTSEFMLDFEGEPKNPALIESLLRGCA